MTQYSSKISIVIPVLNEADSIDWIISHIRSIDRGNQAEIIVVDGGCDKATLKAITDEEVVKISAPTGRGRQMNKGAKGAKGNILLFLHADTSLPKDALILIVSSMEGKDYIGGAFDLGIQSDRIAFRLIEGVASIRSRITRIPFGDQAIFIQKEYFDKINGFKEIPLMEDIEIMQRIKKRGDKIFIIKKKVYTSPRRWEEEGIFFCTIRNWSIQALHFLGVSPFTLAKFYRNS